MESDNWYSGITAGSFGAVAGIFALFFFSDVPKVRKDIMQVGLQYSGEVYAGVLQNTNDGKQRMPIIGDMFVKEVPPSDNVRILILPVRSSWLTGLLAVLIRGGDMLMSV